MRRREFVTLVGGAAVWPFAAQAQSSAKTLRIAVLPDVASSAADWFSAEMQNRRWTLGRDLIVEQFADKLRGLRLVEAAQLVVASKPDLIVTMSTAFALALQRATDTIPIVMMSSGFPVEAGLADSLAKPGRNVTGNSQYAGTGVWGKILQLLHEAAPSITRIGVLWTYVAPAFPKEEVDPCFAELNKVASSLGLQLHVVELRQFNVRAAFAEIEAGTPEGLLLTSFVPPDKMPVVTQFAVDKRLPTVVDFDWAQFGVSPLPLMSYAPDLRALASRAATSADKILRGAKPGDLPIQNPDRFELIVNLKTAQAIGLSLPERFMMRADKLND